MSDATILLHPARLFDGRTLHAGLDVLVAGDRLADIGPGLTPPDAARVVDLPDATLLPGLIEGHGHLFLHPYDEASWDDQVLHEPLSLRTVRAVVHARATLMAGFTGFRDLGTEGAGYADVGLKRAIDEGIVPGPRLMLSTRAIVALGAYGPKGFEPGVCVPQGAEEASGIDGVVRAVRTQMGHGAEVVKLYVDYRWRPGEDSRPTFTEAEIAAAVAVAHDAGRLVAIHATTEEGMRRAVAAGADTIEHGYGGTPAIFADMAAKGIALCPTLGASDAIARYRGWDGSEPAPETVARNRQAFRDAVATGVTIVAGGDVGVFAHGDNVRELELMQAAGMAPIDVLRAVTATNAKVFGWSDRLGKVQTGHIADLVAVAGDPSQDVAALRDVRLVLKGGEIVRKIDGAACREADRADQVSSVDETVRPGGRSPDAR